MKYIFVVLWVCASAFAGEMSRPMDEMHGDCGNYKTDLANEFKLWAKKSEVNPTSIPVGAGVEMKLGDEKEVHFLSPPGKTFPIASQRFGGVFSFKVPASGRYRISVGDRLWFDVVDSGTKKAVESETFEMQSKCKTILKAVEFSLVENVTYSLQLSSASKNQAKVLVTRVGSATEKL